MMNEWVMNEWMSEWHDLIAVYLKRLLNLSWAAKIANVVLGSNNKRIVPDFWISRILELQRLEVMRKLRPEMWDDLLMVPRQICGQSRTWI